MIENSETYKTLKIKIRSPATPYVVLAFPGGKFQPQGHCPDGFNPFVCPDCDSTWTCREGNNNHKSLRHSFYPPRNPASVAKELLMVPRVKKSKQEPPPVVGRLPRAKRRSTDTDSELELNLLRWFVVCAREKWYWCAWWVLCRLLGTTTSVPPPLWSNFCRNDSFYGAVSRACMLLYLAEYVMYVYANMCGRGSYRRCHIYVFIAKIDTRINFV